MEIFPKSQEAFVNFTEGGSHSKGRAKVWDKKLENFITFAETKTRSLWKPNLCTKNGPGTQETTRSHHDPGPSNPNPTKNYKAVKHPHPIRNVRRPLTKG